MALWAGNPTGNKATDSRVVKDVAVGMICLTARSQSAGLLEPIFAAVDAGDFAGKEAA